MMKLRIFKKKATHILFAGHHYYPRGGVADLVARGTVEELKRHFEGEAKAIARGSYIDNWGQIVNAKTMACELWGAKDGEAKATWSETDPSGDYR